MQSTDHVKSPNELEDMTNELKEIPKILVISHRGFMTELFKLINHKIANHSFLNFGEIANCSINIVKMSASDFETRIERTMVCDFMQKSESSQLTQIF